MSRRSGLAGVVFGLFLSLGSCAGRSSYAPEPPDETAAAPNPPLAAEPASELLDSPGAPADSAPPGEGDGVQGGTNARPELAAAGPPSLDPDANPGEGPAAHAPDAALAVDESVVPSAQGGQDDAARFAARRQLYRSPPPPSPSLELSLDGEPVTLNFDKADLAEVIEVVLGQVLRVNYTVAPEVKGSVTFSTASPLPRTQLLGVLQMLLDWNGAVLLASSEGYRVLPRGRAVAGRLAPSLGAVPPTSGFAVRAFPLRSVAPSAMEVLIKPFARESATLLADDRSSLLVMSGTAEELDNYERTIQTFDVDWMEQMSVAVLPLKYVEPQTVADEIRTLLVGPGQDPGGQAGKPPSSGPYRVMPIARLHSLVAMTPRADQMRQIRAWVERLDTPAAAAGGDEADSDRDGDARLYVYLVRNGKATDLAQTLGAIFGGDPSSSAPAKARVAPNLTPAELGTTARDPERGDGEKGLQVVGGAIRFTAVPEQNSLLVHASASQYRAIRGAIAQLDVVPLQVLVEVEVLEVTLNDSLTHGVRWFLQHRRLEDGSATQFGGVGLLGAETSGVSFDYGTAMMHLAGTEFAVQAVVRALEETTRLEVLSSPSVLVLNNTQAKIVVGDQIPVITTQIVTAPGGDADTTTSSVQFQDTGVELTVTPRVNPGGLVFLEIAQEVSDPGAISGPSGNREIQKRSVETKVAVQSGQTVILGGLIRKNDSHSVSGVPFLSDIPWLGAVFRERRVDERRTELVLLVTPRVVQDRLDTDAVVREYRAQFHLLDPILGHDDALRRRPTGSEEAPAPNRGEGELDTADGESSPTSRQSDAPDADPVR